MRRFFDLVVCAATLVSLSASVVSASTSHVSGIVRDETGGVLPGVSVELRGPTGPPAVAVTGGRGDYLFEGVASGRYQLAFTLLNFAAARRDVTVPPAEVSRVDVTLPLALSADVTVTGMRTFANLADLEDPAGNLVGVAQSASQGAITSRQLDVRPMIRNARFCRRARRDRRDIFGFLSAFSAVSALNAVLSRADNIVCAT